MNQHLLQAFGEGRYQLHTIVASYAQNQFVEGNEQANRQALQSAHARAAQHYIQYAASNCPPRGERRQTSDIEPLIEATWHLCQAEQWQEAYNLMEQEGIFSTLKRSGGGAILLELYQLLPLDKWNPQPSQRARIYSNLGVAYRMVGPMEQARAYLERALQIYHELGNRVGEARVLNDLGRVYADMGNRERARRDYEQALHICQEQGDHQGEGSALNNLGWVYIALGQDKQAQEYYEQALRIFRDERDLRGEAWSLNNLGKACKKLGQYEQALDCLEQALDIRREIDRKGEGRTLKNLGAVYEILGHKQQAMERYKQALSIAREIEDHEGQGKTLRNLGKLYLDQQQYKVALASLLLARDILNRIQSTYCDESERGIETLRKTIGEEAFAALLAKVEPRAEQVIEQALA